MNFSVVILTYNEERNLGACIDTLRFCDDIVVVDSFSDDSTCAVAKGRGCRVFEREFDNFAAQRNWAMENVKFKYDWVFHLDADERFTPELAGECEDVVHEDLFSGYMVAGKLMYMGRWLKWSSGFPVYDVRFVKRGEVSFARLGKKHKEASAERGLGVLNYWYLHFPFKNGVEAWEEKHMQFAVQEARHMLQDQPEPDKGEVFSVEDHPLRGQANERSFSHRLPFRPCLRFLYMYFFKKGFLDGLPGFRYCRLMSRYERMVDRRIREIKEADKAADG